MTITSEKSRLIERIEKLPPMRVAEVTDFVEFLSAREERAAAAERLDQAMTRLHALPLPAMTEEEVVAEVHAARQEWRRQAA